MALFAIVCSTWVSINAGRAICCPAGRTWYTSVAEANTMASRMLDPIHIYTSFKEPYVAIFSNRILP